jgi:hypothetical protein
VYPWPKCSTVTWIELPNQDSEAADPYSGKRSRWPSPELSEPVGQKKARPRPPDELVETDSDSDEVEVEEMIIDESFSQKPKSSRRPDRTSRKTIRKVRLDRWAKNRMAHGKQVQDATTPVEGSFSMRVDSDATFPSQGTPCPTEGNVKRKGQFVLLDPGRVFLHMFQVTHSQNLIMTTIECCAIGLRLGTNELEPRLQRPVKARTRATPGTGRSGFIGCAIMRMSIDNTNKRSLPNLCVSLVQFQVYLYVRYFECVLTQL